MVNKWGVTCTVLLAMAAAYASDAVLKEENDDDSLMSLEPEQETLSQDVQNGLGEVSEEQEDEVTAQGVYRHRFIRQGTYVGLRHVKRGNRWMAGWHTNRPVLASCPKLFFYGKRSSCWGEVFRIFRPHRGFVKVGDVVGLYYPRGRRWMGCARYTCYMHPCPGRPTYSRGMQNWSKWRHCHGEIYRIAARGKRVGQKLQNHDIVMLQLARHKRYYLSGTRGHMTRQTCPGSYPPNLWKYDNCCGEVFEINII